MDSSPFTADQSSQNVDPNAQQTDATAAKGKTDVSGQANVEQKQAWDAKDKASTISSLEDLRTKSPELFKQMMQGIAQQICKQMKESQERLKKNMRGQS